MQFVEKYFMQSNVGKEMNAYMQFYALKFVVKTALISGAVFYEKRNNFKITKAVFSFVKKSLKNAFLAVQK